MDNNKESDKFVSEIEQYSISDLVLILHTENELYSKDELEIIQDLLEKKKTSLKLSTADFDFAVILFCIVGLLSLPSALITGVIMMIKGSPKWKVVGKKTLLAAFISLIIRIFLSMGGFSI